MSEEAVLETRTKGLLQSKTTWGVLIAFLGMALGWAPEVQEVLAEDAVRLVSAAFELAGAALALYGRVAAHTEIRGLWARPHGEDAS